MYRRRGRFLSAARSASAAHALRAAWRDRVLGRTADVVRESWLIEDRWWTDRPLRRRYWEVVTTCGRNVVVFRELEERRWYRQR